MVIKKFNLYKKMILYLVLDDSDWLELLKVIDDKTCLPFIDPEATYLY